jgi:hypothetical protein
MDKSITLICVTNVNHKTSEFAINKTIKNVPYIEHVILVSDKKMNINFDYEFIDMNQEKFLKTFQLDNVRNFGIGNYSAMCIAGFPGLKIHTSHVLLVQYDGFATQPEYWDDRYFEYDYIGSLLNPRWAPSKFLFQTVGVDENGNDIFDENAQTWQKYKDWGWANGGGGFSLRSKRLLDVLREDDHMFKDLDNECEDFVLTIFKRDYLEKKHNIKFAPVELCMKWCTELYVSNDTENFSLGFHGLYLAPLFLERKEALEYISSWWNEEYPTPKQFTIKKSTEYLGGIQSAEKLNLFLCAVKAGNVELMDWIYDNNLLPWYVIPPRMMKDHEQLHQTAVKRTHLPKIKSISF